MTATTQTRNAFDALCSLAARENWCWQINCRTCGHIFFRYGLQELARGRHPDSEQWRVAKSHPVLVRGGNPRELAPEPERWIPWPLDLQEHLAQVLADANIETIRATCAYPDWLGYLGLGLKYTEDAERATPLITRSWVPQLLSLLPADADYSRWQLLDLLKEPARALSWRSLGALQSDLQPNDNERLRP